LEDTSGQKKSAEVALPTATPTEADLRILKRERKKTEMSQPKRPMAAGRPRMKAALTREVDIDQVGDAMRG